MRRDGGRARTVGRACWRRTARRGSTSSALRARERLRRADACVRRAGLSRGRGRRAARRARRVAVARSTRAANGSVFCSARERDRRAVGRGRVGGFGGPALTVALAPELVPVHRELMHHSRMIVHPPAEKLCYTTCDSCDAEAHHCTSSGELDVSTFESAGRRVGWGRSVRAASCRGTTKTGQPGKRILTLLAWEESLPCSTRTGCCQPAGRPTIALEKPREGQRAGGASLFTIHASRGAKIVTTQRAPPLI